MEREKVDEDEKEEEEEEEGEERWRIRWRARVGPLVGARMLALSEKRKGEFDLVREKRESTGWARACFAFRND